MANENLVDLECVLKANKWSEVEGSTDYKYLLSITGISAADSPSLVLQDDDDDIMEAFSYIYEISTADNAIILLASEVPNVDINVVVKGLNSGALINIDRLEGFSSITEDLERIMQARYGKDVRQSIHDAIYDINEIALDAKSVSTTSRDSAKAFAENAEASKEASLLYSENAKASEDAAAASKDEATAQAERATTKANLATDKAALATEKANLASDKADEATEQAGIATEKAAEALEYANKALDSESEAAISAGLAKESETAAKESADEAKASEELCKQISDRIGSFVSYGGNINFEDLPDARTLDKSLLYNIRNSFTSDYRFSDGGGVKYPAGTNVVNDNNKKWDVQNGVYQVDSTLDENSANPVENRVIAQALKNVHTVTDSELSETSENPVQNKVITKALQNFSGTKESTYEEWEETHKSETSDTLYAIPDAPGGGEAWVAENIAFNGRGEGLTANDVNSAIIEAFIRSAGIPISEEDYAKLSDEQRNNGTVYFRYEAVVPKETAQSIPYSATESIADKIEETDTAIDEIKDTLVNIGKFDYGEVEIGEYNGEKVYRRCLVYEGNYTYGTAPYLDTDVNNTMFGKILDYSVTGTNLNGEPIQLRYVDGNYDAHVEIYSDGIRLFQFTTITFSRISIIITYTKP